MTELQQRPFGYDAPWTQFSMKMIARANTWLYRRTRGRVGGSMRGAPVALLTTTGRRSGLPRTQPLLYTRVCDDVVIVASHVGMDTHPLWYLNLVSEPNAELQIDAEQWSVRARVAGEDEKARLWPTLLQTYPGYADYVSWTERVVPVVVLEAR